VVATLALTLLGVVISGLFILTRSATAIANTLLYPFYVVSGLVFPVTALPSWLQPVSAMSPLRWAAAGFWAAINGDVPTALRSVWVLLIMVVVMAVIACVCFTVIERRVLREGSLALR
jgi:ABC-2 type transport system permease protein